MEHRWGERVSVRTTVELSCGSWPPVSGYLENLSASGAFVRTDGPRPPRGPVAVMMRQDDGGRRRAARVAAYVVRETANGVGIEWCEFAPRSVRQLLSREQPAEGLRVRAGTRVRHPMPLPLSALGSNTAIPCVQTAASNATPPALLTRAAG